MFGAREVAKRLDGGRTVVLSGFELKRSRGDPIQAPGRFAIDSEFRQISTLNPTYIFGAVLRVG